jgi:hypothetical protein
MNNFVVRVAVVCLLAGLLVVPALAKQELFSTKSAPPVQSTSTIRANANSEVGPVLLADGPSPTPWPKGAGQGGVKSEAAPKLLADGPSPTPWPKGTGAPVHI